MADNRNAGWRGRYGWGESTGARGMTGPEAWDGGWSPDDDAVLQGGYREDGSLRGGRGRGGPPSDGHERRYADRSYGYGPYTPYGRREGGDRTASGRVYDSGYDDSRERRPGESRSFEGHNEYLEAVTDGSDTPGEHRGRGPKGYRRSDERIREDINDRLTEDSWLDATHIEVAVEGGEVTLTGTVSSRQAKRRAEDLAERVSGVDDVQNNIKVNRRSEVNDQTAASTI